MARDSASVLAARQVVEALAHGAVALGQVFALAAEDVVDGSDAVALKGRLGDGAHAPDHFDRLGYSRQQS